MKLKLNNNDDDGNNQSMQAFLYFPILLIARVSWVLQSFIFVFDGLPGANLWTTKGADTLVPKSLASKLEVSLLRYVVAERRGDMPHAPPRRCTQSALLSVFL